MRANFITVCYVNISAAQLSVHFGQHQMYVIIISLFPIFPPLPIFAKCKSSDNGPDARTVTLLIYPNFPSFCLHSHQTLARASLRATVWRRNFTPPLLVMKLLNVLEFEIAKISVSFNPFWNRDINLGICSSVINANPWTYHAIFLIDSANIHLGFCHFTIVKEKQLNIRSIMSYDEHISTVLWNQNKICNRFASCNKSWLVVY